MVSLVCALVLASGCGGVDPEIAWVGLTETEAEEQGTAYEKGAFPWSASGRALTLGRSDGEPRFQHQPAGRDGDVAGVFAT